MRRRANDRNGVELLHDLCGQRRRHPRGGQSGQGNGTRPAQVPYTAPCWARACKPRPLISNCASPGAGTQCHTQETKPVHAAVHLLHACCCVWPAVATFRAQRAGRRVCEMPAAQVLRAPGLPRCTPRCMHGGGLALSRDGPLPVRHAGAAAAARCSARRPGRWGCVQQARATRLLPSPHHCWLGGCPLLCCVALCADQPPLEASPARCEPAAPHSLLARLV